MIDFQWQIIATFLLQTCYVDFLFFCIAQLGGFGNCGNVKFARDQTNGYANCNTSRSDITVS